MKSGGGGFSLAGGNTILLSLNRKRDVEGKAREESGAKTNPNQVKSTSDGYAGKKGMYQVRKGNIRSQEEGKKEKKSLVEEEG